MPANASAAEAIIRNHVHYHVKDISSLADWERMPDLPSTEEILGDDSCDQLPWFPTDHVWNSKSEYLEALYKILRFEGVEGLRYSVRSLRPNPTMEDDDNTCIYTKVHVKGYLFAKLGPIARISFSTVRAGAKIKWKQSKRLQAGKAVALSTDFFKTDCRVAVVAQRPIEGGLDQYPPVVDIIWADATQAIVNPDQELVMVESRNGYYEAVRHALTGLQRAAQEWSPLDKYIVSLNRSDLPCSSVAKTLDFSSIVDLAEDRFQSMNRDNLNNLHDLKPYTSLDDSQLEALQRIVTKEVAIVQGPPGTGKTFTSVKSITAILKNRRAGDPPIILSAQTNHALDQLLIYCKSAGASIMRVGGRTNNDEVAQRTMYELRQSVGGQAKYLDKQRLIIAEHFEALVHGIFGGTGLLDPLTLLEAGVITDAQYKSFVDDDWEDDDDKPAMDAWLGTEKIERIRQIDDLDFDEFEAPDETELDENLDDDDQVDDEDEPIRGRFVPLSSQFTGRKPQISGWVSRCMALLGKYSNLYDIPPAYRGGVYQVMELKLRDAMAAKFHTILDDSIKQARDVKARGWIRDLRVIDRHCIDIIGCTTTGLSKYRGFLSAIQPRILLIEEAAETREANIASALFPSLQQLVLVGDHQQLPPSCDISRLAKEPYNLNVSLFERLVNNNIPYTMLECQRRMAPELRTIVQKFYPKLRDHPQVTDLLQRPLIPGMGNRRSWFFTHQWPEHTDADNSKFNQEEVEMVVSFFCYLLHNGVDTSEITILTYYKGQKRKLLHRLRQRYPTGKFFNVATVDSYQGEENEIVILSLVRSPGPTRDYRVGFLESRNRATVAISRARRGFFMFGNKDNLLQATVGSFTTWAPIWNGFAEQHRVAMSKGMPLVCQNHGNEIWVKEADDLVGNAGGCWAQCDGHLRCGHACGRMCHITSHNLMSCSEPCTRLLECGHKCAGFCSDPCHCAINCPEYVQARLEVQLAQAQLNAGSRLSETPASSSTSPASTDWKSMVQDPDAYDRNERLKAMGHVKVTKDTLETAFGGIKETYIAVSDQNGRRVQKISKNTDVREEARLRKLMAADGGHLSGSDGRPGRQPAGTTLKNAMARTQDPSTNGGASIGHTSTSPGGRDVVHGGRRPNGGFIGGRQGSNMREISDPATINTFAARPSAATAHVRYPGRENIRTNRQSTGESPQRIQSDDQSLEESAATLSTMLAQDDVPNSVSGVGGLGFDEELSQAIRRVGHLQMEGVRQTLPHTGWFQTSDEDLMDSWKPLIDFGNNGTTSMVDKPEATPACQVEKSESLINFELEYE